MIDTHCHIDDPQYADNFDKFIQLQKENGVTHILVPGVNAESIETVEKACSRYEGFLFPAVGIHPEEIKAEWQQNLEQVYNALEKHNGKNANSRYRYIAVGEIGLDYHWDKTFEREQKEAFRQQCTWALDYDLPVMVHSRDAWQDSINILQEFKGIKGVMHCFSGSLEIAMTIVKQGLHLGIGGVLTFKNCKLKNYLANIPLEHIVLETDAPYMAPVPHRGELNESRYMSFVVNELAKIYDVSTQYIDEITTKNAKQLFRLT